MSAAKRAHDGEGGGSTQLVTKKSRADGVLTVADQTSRTVSLPEGSVPRTSDLAAPIVKLAGHDGEVLCARFSGCGQFAATAGFDRQILLWTVFGDSRNYCALQGHAKAVLQVDWSADSTKLFSASADKSGLAWDADYGCKVQRFLGHRSHVNAIAAARARQDMAATGCALAPRGRGAGKERAGGPFPRLGRRGAPARGSCGCGARGWCTGAATHALATSTSLRPPRRSDDGTCRLWDTRMRFAARSLAQPFPCTAVSLDDEGTLLYAGGLDNLIRCYDLRKGDSQDCQAYQLEGHQGTITGTRAAPALTPRMWSSAPPPLRLPPRVTHARDAATFAAQALG